METGELGNRIVDYLGSLFPNIDVKGRRIATVAFLLFVVLVFAFVETQVGYLYYWQAGREIELLQELSLLSSQGIESNQELAPIYFEIVDELSQREHFPIAHQARLFFTSLQPSPIFIRFIVGASVGLFFALLTILMGSGKSALMGSLLFAFVCGILGIFVGWLFQFRPTIYYVGYPLLQILFLFFISKRK